MSAPPRIWFTAFPLLSLMLTFLFPGCHKKPKVEFPRLPASASVPENPPPAPGPAEAEAPPTEPGPTPAEPPPAGNHRPRPPRRPPPPSEPALPTSEPPPAPSPRLASGSEDAVAIQEKIRSGEALLLSVRDRTLTPQQREQAETATGFLAQAKEAVAEGEWRRAAVLADKAFVLAEDVERTSRD